MSVSLITFQRSTNFGAVLQCWALTRFLIDRGHHVSVLDYNPPHRASLSRPVSLLKLSSYRNLYAIPSYLRFRAFIRHHIPLSSRGCTTLSDLAASARGSSAVVCGSDQIWNPNHTGGRFDPAYFAAFASEPTRRISYAASVGAAEVSTDHLPDLVRLLGAMNSVSVREASVCRFLTEKLSIDCTTVLDPTLLGVDYASIERPISAPSKFILAYGLRPDPLYRSLIQRCAAELKLPVVQIRKSRKVDHRLGSPASPSPGQWLSWIRSAALVITNSFHGVAFAINYRRPFHALGLPGQLSQRNVRLMDLLSTLGLCDRFIPGDTDPTFVRSMPLLPEISWSAVSLRLSSLQAASREYLLKALNSTA